MLPELLDEDLLVSLQDLGAAGIHLFGFRDGREGQGRDRDRDRHGAPAREWGWSPREVMISESQERMLAVVEPEKVDEVLWIAER